MPRIVIHAAGDATTGYHKIVPSLPGGGYGGPMVRDLDGGCVPCGCCGCTPNGSAYRFDRSYVWRQGLAEPVNSPSDYQATLSVSFSELSSYLEHGTGPTAHRVTAELRDFGVLADISSSSGFPDPLIDRSYDGHCGFGTGFRDIGPPGSWDQGDTPVDRGVIDEVTVYRSHRFPDDGGSGVVRYRPEGGDEQVFGLASVDYRVVFRVVADSRGANQDRDGMSARMRGVWHADGSDAYAPCVDVEAKLVIDRAWLDIQSDAGVPEAVIGFVDDGGAQTRYAASVNPGGYYALHDHVGRREPDQGDPGSGALGMVAAGMSARAYLSGGQVRRGGFIGRTPQGAFNGLGGYPDPAAIDDISEVANTPVMVGDSALGDDDLSVSNRLDSVWVRTFTARTNPGHGLPSVVHERARVTSMRVSLLLGLTDGDGAPSSMLGRVPGWTPTPIEGGTEEDDKPVSVYRPCGSACNQDRFVDPVALPPQSPELVIDNMVHHWAGQTVINTPDPAYVDDPMAASSSACAINTLAQPCDGGPSVRIVKGPGFFDGGTGMIGGVRHRHLVGTTHPDPDAPEHVFINQPCDGHDEHPVAVACDGSGDSIVYDAQSRPPGALTLVWNHRQYTPTTQTTAAPVTAGAVWSDQACPGDPGDEIYWIHHCRRTSRVAYTLVPMGENLPPVQMSVGYRPGTGMQPGVGHVYYGAVGSGGCVVAVAGQPSTEVMDTEPDVVLTSRPGGCGGKPSANIDPRPHCRGVEPDDPVDPNPRSTDGGGGGGVDPRVAAELARQQQAYTGQYPGRCPSCGG